jgi:hypothetical protein
MDASTCKLQQACAPTAFLVAATLTGLLVPVFSFGQASERATPEQDSSPRREPGRAAGAGAAPFGVKKGMTLADLRRIVRLEKTGEGTYTSKSAPQPHASFDSYVYLASETLGVCCKVWGVSKPIKTNRYGQSVVADFDKLDAGLQEKYGARDRFDYLHPGSTWNEPQDWMTGLLKQERTLTSYWTREKSTLPDDVESIALEALAISPQTGFVKVGYELSNFQECMAERQAKAK